VGGHGKLQEDTVHLFVSVKSTEHVQHLTLLDIPGEMLVKETHPRLFARLSLSTDVQKRVGPLANYNGGKAWRLDEPRFRMQDIRFRIRDKSLEM